MWKRRDLHQQSSNGGHQIQRSSHIFVQTSEKVDRTAQGAYQHVMRLSCWHWLLLPATPLVVPSKNTTCWTLTCKDAAPWFIAKIDSEYMMSRTVSRRELGIIARFLYITTPSWINSESLYRRYDDSTFYESWNLSEFPRHRSDKNQILFSLNCNFI